MAAYVPLNERALEAFDVLAAGGLPAATHRAETFLACFRRERDAAGLLAELEQIRDAGQQVGFHPVTGWRVRAMEPALSDRVGAAVQIHGQRYLHPPEFVWSLALAVRDRGGEVVEGVDVTDLRHERGGVAVVTTGGERRRHDAVVIATGAWLGDLAGRFGVRQPVQAGRGYSFSVPVEQMPRGPLYFPTQRVALTPLGSRLRVAGMMEFRRPGDPARSPTDHGDRRRRPAVPDRGGPRRAAQRVGRLAAVHPRRAAPGGPHRVSAGVRRRRARHVGHRARSAHRAAAGPDGRSRARRRRSSPRSTRCANPRSADPALDRGHWYQSRRHP